MYGSNFWSATDRPRATSRRPIEAAAMPLPSEETTPPVTKMKRVAGGAQASGSGKSSVDGAVRRIGSNAFKPLEQLLGVAAGRGVGRLGAEHPHELADDVAAVERGRRWCSAVSAEASFTIGSGGRPATRSAAGG